MKKMYLKISLILLFICLQSVFAFKLNVKNDSDLDVTICVCSSMEKSKEYKTFDMKPKTKISTNKFFEKDFERLVITPHQKDGELCSEDPSFDFKDKLPPSVYHWQEYSFVIETFSFNKEPMYSGEKKHVQLCRYDENLTREEWNEKYRDLDSPFEEVVWFMHSDIGITHGKTKLTKKTTSFNVLDKKPFYLRQVGYVYIFGNKYIDYLIRPIVISERKHPSDFRRSLLEGKLSSTQQSQ